MGEDWAPWSALLMRGDGSRKHAACSLRDQESSVGWETLQLVDVAPDRAYLIVTEQPDAASDRTRRICFAGLANRIVERRKRYLVTHRRV